MTFASTIQYKMAENKNYSQPPPYSPYPERNQPTPGIHGMYAPPPNYNNPSAPINMQSQYVPSYGTNTTTVIVPPEIIIVGACPACRIGIFEDDYPCLAIFCAIFFFPVGLLCCLLMKNKRCSNCGAIFG